MQNIWEQNWWERFHGPMVQFSYNLHNQPRSQLLSKFWSLWELSLSICPRNTHSCAICGSSSLFFFISPKSSGVVWLREISCPYVTALTISLSRAQADGMIQNVCLWTLAMHSNLLWTLVGTLQAQRPRVQERQTFGLRSCSKKGLLVKAGWV